MNDQEINLKLTVDEINLILEAVGNMPFKVSYPIVMKIQKQASEQLAPDEAREEAKSKKKK